MLYILNCYFVLDLYWLMYNKNMDINFVAVKHRLSHNVHGV